MEYGHREDTLILKYDTSSYSLGDPQVDPPEPLLQMFLEN